MHDHAINLDAFQDACVPTALAALTALTRQSAARLLADVQVRTGRLTAPAAPVEHVAVALREFGGYSIEPIATAPPWTPTMPAAEYLETITVERSETTCLVPSMREQAAAAGFDAADIDRIAEVRAAKFADRPTLRDFLSAGLSGRHLVVVMGPDPTTSHAIATIDGHLVAGDDSTAGGYGQRPVLSAFRITPITEATGAAA